MDTATDRPTFGEMLGEVIDLSSGLAILLLPLYITAIPGIVLLLVLPALFLLAVAAVPVVVAGLVLTPPYLLVRAIRRRLRR